MSGLMSRRKGSRCEYLVRDHLRGAGYTDAVRVPLSGASEGFKGDVIFTNSDGVKETVEVKSRKKSFTTLYKHYVNTVVHHPMGIITIWVWGGTGGIVYCRETEVHSKRDETLFKTLYKLKAGADLLVVKDNNQPLLWLRWDTKWE